MPLSRALQETQGPRQPLWGLQTSPVRRTLFGNGGGEKTRNTLEIKLILGRKPNMRIFPNKFPFNVPYIFSSLVSVVFLSYLMTGLILEMKTGRPSSTSAIGFVFIPVYAFIIFLFCFPLGLLMRLIVGKIASERIIAKSTALTINIMFVVAIVISSVAGGISFRSYEDRQTPHVIFNSSKVTKIPSFSFQENKKIDAMFLLTIFDDEKNQLKNLTWNDVPIHFELKKDINSLKLLDDKGKELASINLRQFDYITRVYATPFSVSDSASKGLAVLVHLRSTSSRSMLLIYNQNAELTYQELLYRRKIDDVLKVVKDMAGKEYLWLNVNTPVIYSTN